MRLIDSYHGCERIDFRVRNRFDQGGAWGGCMCSFLPLFIHSIVGCVGYTL